MRRDSRARAQETYRDWPAVRDRLSQLRLAGFKAQAVDMGAAIHVHIAPGPKHRDLTHLPRVNAKGV